MTLADRVNQATDQLIAYGVEPVLAYALCEAAGRYWQRTQPEDFCVQQYFGDCIVFGSVNRVVWRPAGGFIAQAAYCSTQFLANYNQVGKLPDSI